MRPGLHFLGPLWVNSRHRELRAELPQGRGLQFKLNQKFGHCQALANLVLKLARPHGNRCASAFSTLTESQRIPKRAWMGFKLLAGRRPGWMTKPYSGDLRTRFSSVHIGGPRIKPASLEAQMILLIQHVSRRTLRAFSDWGRWSQAAPASFLAIG